MSEPTVHLRPATAEDAKKIWEWRNETTTRAASYNSEPIPYADHVRWFDQRLAGSGTRFLIAVDRDGQDIGFARLELSGELAEVSLSLDASRRGRGLGMWVIRAASDFALKELRASAVIAHVKLLNNASIRAFTQAGFVVKRHCCIAGTESVEMIYPEQNTKETWER
jgi:RimJ/RimL family protein N-acetyltransferase